MKKPEIFQFKVEINRCYIIQQEGTIMMDGGSPNQIESIKKSFKTLNINPKDIRLVVLSHGHFDHIGGLYSLFGFLRMIGREDKLEIYIPENCREVEGIISEFKRIYEFTTKCTIESKSIPFLEKSNPIF